MIDELGKWFWAAVALAHAFWPQLLAATFFAAGLAVGAALFD